MAVARPRREQQHEPGSVLGAQRVSLVGIEAHQRPRPSLRCVAVDGDRDRAVDHRHPRVLLHLMIAERLSGAEDDQHRARSIV